MSRINHIAVGDALPERRYETDIVGQFLFNAALWNAHRIHYDLDYATSVEKYPGLVVAGPLMGDWLAQTVTDWLGEDGRLLNFEYANRRAAIVGDVLISRGAVEAIDQSLRCVTLTLEIVDESGTVLTPGRASARFF